jgi:hypothetical protein
MASRKAQKGWLWGFIIFTILLTSLPYILGYSHQGSEWVFTGFVFGVEDGNSYIAKMLSGASGNWLFRTPYTNIAQNGFLAFLPYILLGKLAGGIELHAQLVALFHIFRAAGIIVFVLATYDFCKLFIQDEYWQRWAVALATFGGGLGWLTIFGLKTGGYEQLPLEFYSPESFGFLGVFGLPHLAFARALLLWGLAAFLSPSRENPLVQGLKAGIYWLILGFMQPLTIVSGWAVLGAGIVFHRIWLQFSPLIAEDRSAALAEWRRRIGVACGMLLISAPFVLYNFLAFVMDPFLKGWSQQNLIFSPPPVDYLLAYGLILPFAIAGAIKILRGRAWNWSIPLAWVVIFPLLAYFPYPLQRRLPEGVWVAWILLALAGLDLLKRKWKKPAMAFIATGFLSTLLFYAGALWSVTVPAEPQYQPSSKIAAYQYLADEAEKYSVVLGSYNTGNSLPAWAPVRVVIGHGPESVNLAALQPQVNGIFSTTTADSQRLTFLREQDVQYLFYGPDERALGDWNPESSSFLDGIYSQDGYTIYQIDLSE